MMWPLLSLLPFMTQPFAQRALSGGMWSLSQPIIFWDSPRSCHQV